MKTYAALGLVLVLVAVAGLATARAIAGGCCGTPMSSAMTPAAAQTAAVPTLSDVAKTQTAKLAEALAALDAAKKAIDSGDNKAALAALDTAKAAVSAANDSVAKYASKVVNARCPMMGGAVNPAKLADALTRDYKGQKVGFCCDGCPANWDKLTDADKDAKLAKALASGK